MASVHVPALGAAAATQPALSLVEHALLIAPRGRITLEVMDELRLAFHARVRASRRE